MRSRLANSAMYVAERDGDIVGFANFQRSRTVPEEAELTAIYLLPEAQGMGIGTLLLNAGVRELDGVKRLIADVERHNASGLRFYRARGFKTVGEHEATLNGYALPMARMCLSINNH